MKQILILLFTIVLIPLNNYSQSDSIPKKNNRLWENLKYDTNSILKNVGHSFTQPLQWQNDDFSTLGGVIIGTGLLYLSDNESRKIFLKQNDHVPNVLKEFGWYFGSPQNFFIVSAGIYGFGFITDNEKVRQTGVLIFSSAITTGIIQSLSKTIVGRARPSGGDHDDFKPFSKESKFHSFPSGHAILSFSMAHSIAKQFDNFWVKAGIYSIGSIAPISRLWKDAHWISDVGLGMAISVIVVDGIDNYMKKEKRYTYKESKQISWRLTTGLGTIGIIGTF